MSDITTALVAVLQRSVISISDDIAKDGLKLLKTVLEDAGFGKSEYLKDYELFAHSSGQEITFEISLSIDAVEDEESDSSDELELDQYKQQVIDALDKQLERSAINSFGISIDGQTHKISRMRNIRSSSHDARKSSHDARKSSHGAARGADSREYEHEAAAAAPRSLFAPRSMEIDRSGKLKLSFTRKIRKTMSGHIHPKGNYDGLMNKFIDGMKSVIAKRFIPELSKILSRYTDD